MQKTNKNVQLCCHSVPDILRHNAVSFSSRGFIRIQIIYEPLLLNLYPGILPVFRALFLLRAKSVSFNTARQAKTVIRQKQ